MSLIGFGQDGSLDASRWGHASNAVADALDADELHFFARTSHHDRVIDFTTRACSALVRSGVGTCVPEGATLLLGHTAQLPYVQTNAQVSAGDAALVEFPFSVPGALNWAIGGAGNRWEVDDANAGAAYDTLHRVWARSDCPPGRGGASCDLTTPICVNGSSGSREGDDPRCADNCQSLCGDGIISGLESCDPGASDDALDDEVRDLVCANFGWYRGMLRCAADCQALDFGACSGFCGDAVVDSAEGESCDGDAVSSFTCRDFGARGAIGCTGRCQLSSERCFNGGWRTVDVATLDALTDIGGSGATDFWIVGSGNQARHFDGTTFRAHALPDAGWEAVWSSGPEDVWAVGELGNVARFDGTQWQLFASGGATFRDVAGSGPTDIWAVGEGGRVAHYDGVALTDLVPFSANDLLGIAVLSPSSVYVVGVGEIWSFDGVDWTLEVNDPSKVYQAVAIGPSGALWAGGNDGVFATSAPGSESWTVLGAPVSGVIADFAVFADAPSWLVGASGAIARIAASTWSAVMSPTTHYLNAVYGASPHDIWAVGDKGTTLHFIGAGFDVFSPPGSLPTRAMHGAAPDDLWVVGNDALVAHVAGGVIETQTLGVTSEDLLGVVAFSPDDVWAVGDAGTVVHRSAGVWSLVATPVTTRLTRVGGTGPENVWAAGGSQVLHWNGAWTVFDLSFEVRALWVSAEGDVWVGGDAVLTRLDGGLFVPVSVRGQESNDNLGFNAIWGASANDVWVLASNGEIFHWDGVGVRDLPQQASLGPGPVAIFGSGANDVWFGGDTDGVLMHYDGADVAEAPSVTGQGIVSIYSASPSSVWALTGDGSLLHLPHEMPSAVGGLCLAPVLIACGAHRSGSTYGAPAGFDVLTSPECGTQDATGGERYFRLDVPAGVRVTATLTPMNGDLDLIALAGVASRRACDPTACLTASNHPGLASEVLVVDDHASLETIFFVVHGDAASFDLAVVCEKR